MSTLSKILINKDKTCKSIWFMRQAGRYLPEFQKIRSHNKNFINLCLNSELCSEITLQPIKRFNLDSAIIFSDILMVPYALGQKVDFIKDHGPILSNFNLNDFLKNDITSFTKKLNPVYEAIRLTREKLNPEKSLISFIGAPWTLLIYMLGLKVNKNEINLSKIKNKEIDLDIILNKINEYLCAHIESQINSGADTVQIFDSWAGLISKEDLSKLCYFPNLKIVEFCKSKKIPVICFPKGIKENYIKFNEIVKPDCLSLDYDVNPVWAKDNLPNTPLQGGMNPRTLLKPLEEIYKEAELYLNTFKDIPYIFNLGHGLVPETDPDKLEKLINFVRKHK